MIRSEPKPAGQRADSLTTRESPKALTLQGSKKIGFAALFLSP
jgi:hypothetical protein